MTKITEKTVKALTIGTRITDEAITGFIARCLPSGEISFGYQYTNKATGARKWIGIGLHGNVTVERARELALQYAGEVAGKHDPAHELKISRARSTNTVDYVLDEYLKVHADKNCRGAVAIRQSLANHARPALGNKIIYDLRLPDIVKLMDKIGEHHTRMPGIVFGHLRAAFNFWQLRDAEFKNPIVRGAIKETAEPRNRVLAPDELADIWRALDELEHVPATFAAYVKILVLTACRRCEVANMHSDEIDGKTWTIPAARYKTGIDHVVPLIGPIKKLLPKIHNGYVFGCASHRHHQAAGAAPLRGYHKAKRELDAAIAEIRRREGRKPMRPWTFHDLRRTAATMMEQIGINDKVAEAVLGHAKIGIRKHYNHYKFLPEKTAALEKLAAHVERITKPRTPAAATKLRLVAG